METGVLNEKKLIPILLMIPQSVRRLLLILYKFQVQMFYPYVLMRLRDVDQNENDSMLITDFNILESFIVRRKISHRATNDDTSKCYSIIKNGIVALIKSDLGNDSADLTNRDVKTYLQAVKDDTAKVVLFWIELYRRRLNAFDVNALEYKYTLEHIMPKKWDTYWSEVSIIDGDKEYAPESEEGQAFRNAAIRNNNFASKIQGGGEQRPGYKNHTSLLVTKEICDEAENDLNWDEQHIDMRTQKLYEEFIILWPSYTQQVAAEEPEGEDPDISRFTEEQLADATKLLDVVL